MAARAALSPGPGRRGFQARALRRRRPQPRPFVRLGGGGGALALGSRLPARLARPGSQSRSAPQPARTPPVPARVSASPPLGSAPPSARPGVAAAAAGGGGGGSSCQERQARPVPRPSHRRLRRPAGPRPPGGGGLGPGCPQGSPPVAADQRPPGTEGPEHGGRGGVRPASGRVGGPTRVRTGRCCGETPGPTPQGGRKATFSVDLHPDLGQRREPPGWRATELGLCSYWRRT